MIKSAPSTPSREFSKLSQPAPWSLAGHPLQQSQGKHAPYQTTQMQNLAMQLGGANSAFSSPSSAKQQTTNQALLILLQPTAGTETLLASKRFGRRSPDLRKQMLKRKVRQAKQLAKLGLFSHNQVGSKKPATDSNATHVEAMQCLPLKGPSK